MLWIFSSFRHRYPYPPRQLIDIMTDSASDSLGKKLGLFDVFCIAAGAMISSGLFVLPGLAHAQAGPAVVFSYFLAGVLATTGMLSVAEIITAMPKAGGDYFFIMRTMGPAAGAVAGLLSWFSLSLKASFALVGMSAFLAPLLGWDEPKRKHEIELALTEAADGR